MDDDDEFSGSSRTQLSPEAINDFQIVHHGFAAQSGGAAGGAVDVQTRAGLNNPHGDAFIFAQNGVLNGTPPSAFTHANRMRAVFTRESLSGRHCSRIGRSSTSQPNRSWRVGRTRTTFNRERLHSSTPHFDRTSL